jgi:hypothetical protein
MSIVQLQILEPQRGAHFQGISQSQVRMRGQVLSTGHPPLFFKWYSSLHFPPQSDPKNAALNSPADDPLNFTPSLTVGSHVLTFTAKDKPTDSLGDLKAAQDAGMTGGPLTAQSPCLIHLFIAKMIFPAAGATLSKANSTLQAEAPVQWDKPDYQSINRLRYHWRFVPAGQPANRHSADLIPAVNELTFHEASGAIPAYVQYQGHLPNELNNASDIGNYTLILRVEDIQDNTTRDEVSVPVVIAP